MQKISKEYVPMFMTLKNNILKTIDNSNYIPSYIKEAENSMSITNDIEWGIDLPSTVFLSFIKYYNNENTYNKFFEKYKAKNAYHIFLYNYFIRRCSLCHTCSILNKNMIDLLKKYIAIYKEFNNGRFNKEPFEGVDIRSIENYEDVNIDANLKFIDTVYNKDMIKAEQNRVVLFNYPYFCNDFLDQDYTQQFYSNEYNLYWTIASKYIEKRSNSVELSNILELFELIHFEDTSKDNKQIKNSFKIDYRGGSIDDIKFIRTIRHYGYSFQ